jgi:hypothetical protein
MDDAHGALHPPPKRSSSDGSADVCCGRRRRAFHCHDRAAYRFMHLVICELEGSAHLYATRLGTLAGFACACADEKVLHGCDRQGVESDYAAFYAAVGSPWPYDFGRIVWRPLIRREPVTGSLFLESRMVLPPIAHHLTINLAGVAERLRFRFDDFVPPLARATARVFRLVLAHTPTVVMRLALLHDALPNPVVR